MYLMAAGAAIPLSRKWSQNTTTSICTVTGSSTHRSSVSILALRLAALVAQLHAALREEGFTLDARPFCPHLTLARKVRAAADLPLEPPFVWQSSGFALVRSVTDLRAEFRDGQLLFVRQRAVLALPFLALDRPATVTLTLVSAGRRSMVRNASQRASCTKAWGI